MSVSRLEKAIYFSVKQHKKVMTYRGHSFSEHKPCEQISFEEKIFSTTTFKPESNQIKKKKKKLENKLLEILIKGIKMKTL